MRFFHPNTCYKGENNIEKGNGFSLCVIEFDDQGELWNPIQLENTLKHIQSASNGKEIAVITFIHGWTHNASEEDTNLHGFHSVLESRVKKEIQYAQEEDQGNTKIARHIIGIYVAWRGGILTLPFLKVLTFWNRKATAVRVGNISCTEVLFSIMMAVKANNERSQCIFVGHSFGGLILEKSIYQSLIGLLLQQKDTMVYSPADLIVLVNPASQAIDANQFIDFLNRKKVRVVKGGKFSKDEIDFPLLVSATSVGDNATKLAFPLGQFIVRLTKAFRIYLNQRMPHQKYLFSHTPGHTSYFHNLEVKKLGPQDESSNQLEFEYDGVRYKIKPKDNERGSSVYWIMEVPKQIIQDHSRIFRSGFPDMLSALLDWTSLDTDKTMLKIET